jgi:hypothetical protein
MIEFFEYKNGTIKKPGYLNKINLNKVGIVSMF